jgi:hypothetical protein
MKWILLAVALVLAFSGGGRRTRSLLGALKQLPRDFKAGRDRARDPVGHARDVTPSSSSSSSAAAEQPDDERR